MYHDLVTWRCCRQSGNFQLDHNDGEPDTCDTNGDKHRTILCWRNDHSCNTNGCWCNIQLDRSGRIYFYSSEPDTHRSYACDGRNIFSYCDERSRMHECSWNNHSGCKCGSCNTDSFQYRTILRRCNNRIVDTNCCRCDILMDWTCCIHFNFTESNPSILDNSNGRHRSEEHTSELQSRFGISYAVFCL